MKASSSRVRVSENVHKIPAQSKQCDDFHECEGDRELEVAAAPPPTSGKFSRP